MKYFLGGQLLLYFIIYMNFHFCYLYDTHDGKVIKYICYKNVYKEILVIFNVIFYDHTRPCITHYFR